MSISNLTPSQLRQAAAIIEQIETLQSELKKLGAGTTEPSGVLDGTKPARKRRKISAAGIARIRAAQKLRWAKVHAARKK